MKDHPVSTCLAAPRAGRGSKRPPGWAVKRREARPRLSLRITAEVGARFITKLRRHLRAAHALLRTKLHDVSVVLVNDKTMSLLHQRTMKIPGPTDVLTFPLDLDSQRRALAGEIVVCVPEARRRARELGTRVADEVLLYALHGMLHLSGFDDRTQREFDRMHRMEDQILTRLGIGPVFQPAASESNKARSLRSARGKGSS